MQRLLSILAASAISLCMSAQTAQKLTLDITENGESNMQVFLPEKPNGVALVACPGGGYSHLAMQHEGTDWAEYFNSQGITYCVLTYRMPGGDRTIPMSDAENAIRKVRENADAWGVDTAKVGIMGSSAGGHLASTIATHATGDAKPDFQILFYPVISMDINLTHKGSVMGFLGDKRSYPNLVELYSNDKQVRKGETPQAFIVTAGDDRVVPVATNTLPYYEALLREGIPAALHVYPDGGHGFGFRSSFAYHDEMLADLKAWLGKLSEK